MFILQGDCSAGNLLALGPAGAGVGGHSAPCDVGFDVLTAAYAHLVRGGTIVSERQIAAGRLWMVDDDILVMHVTIEARPTLEHVAEYIEAVTELVEGHEPVGLLNHLETAPFFDASLIDVMEQHADWFNRLAFVVNSAFQTAAVRTFLFATREPMPAHVTRSFDDALAWLRGPGLDEARRRQVR